MPLFSRASDTTRTALEQRKQTHQALATSPAVMARLWLLGLLASSAVAAAQEGAASAEGSPELDPWGLPIAAEPIVAGDRQLLSSKQHISAQAAEASTLDRAFTPTDVFFTGSDAVAASRARKLAASTVCGTADEW